MSPSMKSTLVLVAAALQPVLAGAIEKRDVFSPARVNIPLGFGPAGQYVMPVDMATGDNTQHFNFTITLGTGLTYVAGTQCSACNGIKTYDQSKSTTASTLQSNVTSNLLSDVASGAVIKETCAMKTSNGSNWNYPNQTIVVVNNQQTSGSQISSLLGSSTGLSGLVGLGTNLGTANRNADNANTYQAGFQDSIYGQWLNRNPTATNFSFGMQLSPPVIRRKNTTGNSAPSLSSTNANGGLLHWLQPDQTAYKPDQVSWKNVDNAAGGAAAGNNANSNGSSSTNTSAAGTGDWLLGLDGWTVSSGNSQASNADPVVADVEALYTELYFPQQAATAYHAAIKGSKIAQGLSSLGSLSQAYTVPCDAQIDFSFIVGDQKFTLNRDALMVKQDDGTCVSAIEAWTDPNKSQYLLGSTFISSVYLIFQITRDGKQTVGFAPLADSEKKTNVGAIVGGTIGGVAFLVILGIGGFFLYRHYRRKQSTLGQFDPQLDLDKQATPYTLGAPAAGEVTTYSPPDSAGAATANQPFLPHSPATSSFRPASTAYTVSNPRAASADPLMSEILSDHSAAHPLDGALPPAYEASEASVAALNPDAVRNRPPVREKGGYVPNRQSTNDMPGAGPSGS
ncbi:acid protease [Panus rudis PR-1116 ss-1]|nr:acid protease [Panus rudis PR-1116 ss-1]